MATGDDVSFLDGLIDYTVDYRFLFLSHAFCFQITHYQSHIPPRRTTCYSCSKPSRWTMSVDWWTAIEISSYSNEVLICSWWNKILPNGNVIKDSDLFTTESRPWQNIHAIVYLWPSCYFFMHVLLFFYYCAASPFPFPCSHRKTWFWTGREKKKAWNAPGHEAHLCNLAAERVKGCFMHGMRPGHLATKVTSARSTRFWHLIAE